LLEIAFGPLAPRVVKDWVSMTKTLLISATTLGIFIFGFSAHAEDVQFVLKDYIPMNVQSVEGVSQAVAQVVAAGTYVGKSPDDTVCNITVSTNPPGSGLPASVYPRLFMSDNFHEGDALPNSGSNLIIYTPFGENVNFRSYLFGLFVSPPTSRGEETIRLGVETAREEGEAHAAFVTITGKGGVPSAIQLGSAVSPEGQGRRFLIGQVASVQWDAPCSGLVKIQ